MYLPYYYIVGSGPIWLESVDCTGSEVTIAECGHPGWGVHSCDHSRDAVIICDNSKC